LKHRIRGTLRGRIGKTAVLVLLVTVLVVAITAAYVVEVVLPSFSPSQVEVSDLCAGAITTVNVTYEGSQSGYLSTSYGISPANCVTERVPPSSQLTAGLNLHNSDPANAHSIRTVTILPPYNLVGTSPSVPATIAAGGNVTFGVTFQVPSAGGTYDAPTASVTTS
jgi:hypothetical protein